MILALTLLPSAGLAQSNSPAVEQQIVVHVTGTYPDALLVAAVEDQIQEWFERDANGLGGFGVDTSCCYKAEITTLPISLSPSCVNLTEPTIPCTEEAVAQGASIVIVESITLQGQPAPIYFVQGGNPPPLEQGPLAFTVWHPTWVTQRRSEV